MFVNAIKREFLVYFVICFDNDVVQMEWNRGYVRYVFADFQVLVENDVVVKYSLSRFSISVRFAIFRQQFTIVKNRSAFIFEISRYEHSGIISTEKCQLYSVIF